MLHTHFAMGGLPRTFKETLCLLGWALLVMAANGVLNPRARGAFSRNPKVFERPVQTHLPPPEAPADTSAFLALEPSLALVVRHGAVVVSADSVYPFRFFPPEAPESWLLDLLNLALDTPLVVTDTAVFRHRARQLARLLWSLGFRRAWVTVVPAEELARRLRAQAP